MASYPVLNPSIVLLAGEAGYMAYDPAKDFLHTLNPVASLIVELSDGSRTSEEIRKLLEPILPEDAAELLERWMHEAVAKGVLQESEAPASRPSEVPLSELRRIATRFGETNRLEVALLCWKAIVQRAPEDADAWFRLGNTAYWLERYPAARAAYAKYLEFHPEDERLQHLVLALGEDAPPPRAPNACVEQIYRQFAPRYDAHMREALNYEAPERLGAAIAAAVGARRRLSVLDLGCGSGLLGPELKQWAAELTGVDLSPEMIALAKGRGIYDQLDVAEITEWLESSAARFDLIAACECLEYFGDLTRVLSLAARRLNDNGILALTVERSKTYPFQLTKSGRYAHHADHLREAAAPAGLSVKWLRDEYLRMEYDQPAIGTYVVLGKA